VLDIRLDVVRLDVADLFSVESAAHQLTDELPFGGNYLGHFALIARLFPLLRDGARVVTVGSVTHRWSPLNLDDLQGEHGFRAAKQYGRSKIAMMSFALELDRRCRAAGRSVLGLTAHPGFAPDSLTPPRPGVNQMSARARVLDQPTRPVCQGKDAGAWPLVHAAGGEDVEGGQYWGSRGWQELTGAPALSHARAHARNPSWPPSCGAQSEELIGVPFVTTHRRTAP